jgi:hypothetical protein
MRKLLPMVLTGAILVLPLATWADDLDHAALAAQYEQEAKDARALAEKHKAMKKRYDAIPVSKLGTPGNSMEQHCTRLIADYEEAATDAEAMAKAHRDAAAN